MKTQISRDTLAPEQRYAGVFLQQGRMILDADWNELSALHNLRLVEALRDAISGRPADPTDLQPLGGAPRHGGLRLLSEPDGSTNIRLQPGLLYVDGVPALLPGSATIAVNAQLDYPLQATYSGQSLKLYADVWDRCVTGLERPELLDPALHGADTTTRSQTLLQVKWCPAAQNPLDPTFNPPLGNAPLTLTLRKIDSGNDPCNPCAQQVQVNERLGNYLFRVEVHDVDLAANTLTLKWSRDNGAEAAAVGELPSGFNQGDWVWEFFDTDTERLLGLHFAPNPLKLRGLIKESCVTPLGANEPKAFVRQWDGYGVFRLDTAALVNGRDRGVALFSGAADDPAHGRASAEAGKLQLSLEGLSLHLGVESRQFVPGDYWQASVREAVQASGDVVLSAGLPRGVRHHYLLLGELRPDGTLKLPPDDAARRRMAFPPLSDLRATDVGFSDHCPGLFMGAQNLQQALDNLCAIGADDISYTLPNCATSPNVRELLGLKGVSTKVSNVLDQLLCELRANDIPLDKTDAGLCADLQLPTVVSVQDALKALCEHSGGCEVSIRTSEQLMQRLKQAAADGTGSLWLKLCAGSYTLTEPLTIRGLTSLRMSGESAAASRITLEGNSPLLLAAEALILENLGWVFKQPAARLDLHASTVTVRDCTGLRETSLARDEALVTIGGQEAQGCTLHWSHNQWRAWVTADLTLSWGPARRTAADEAFVAAMGNYIEVLSPGQQWPASEVQRRLDELLVTWRALGIGLQREWVLAMNKSPGLPARVPSELNGGREPVRKVTVSRNLSSPTLPPKQQADGLDGLARLVMAGTPDELLRLDNINVGGRMEGSSFEGWLRMANGLPRSPTLPFELRDSRVETVIVPGGASLHLNDNSLTGVLSNWPADAVTQWGEVVGSLPGHARMVLSANHFLWPGNVFTASTWIGQGNTWDYDSDDDNNNNNGQFRPGYALCDRATFTGNVLEGYRGNTVIECVGDDQQSSLNVRIELDRRRL